MPRRAFGLLISCLGVTLAACGGSGSSSSSDASTSGDDGGGGTDAASTTDTTTGGGSDGATTTPPPTDSGPVTPPSTSCAPPIKAVDTGASTNVVGTGTSASCTETALAAAIAKGGIITFSCGGAATITVTKTLALPTDKDTVIDGGGKVILDGGGAVRILDWNSPGYRTNTHSLTLQHITLQNAKATGTKSYPSHPLPCSSGFYDGAGGALQMRDGVLAVIDATFIANQAAPVGPDVGGGAIYVNGVKQATIVSSTFKDNGASNGGAIGSLNSELDVYDSTFQGNVAMGFGANSDDKSKCTFQDPVTKQYQIGSGGNGGAVVIDGGSDGTHTFCGVTFKANKGGNQALGGAIFRTPDGAKQVTVIDRSLFDSNTGDAGGACYFHNSDLKITASTFTGNVGQGIGCIQADGTTFEFTNVTFAGNHSKAGVGATLANLGGDGTLLNCTFFGNVCDADNMFAAAIFGSPTLTIKNTLFDANTAKNPGAPMQCQVSSSTTGSGDLQWPKKKVNGGADDQACVTGVTFADPMLGALGDHGGPVPTLLPSAGSPALGAGTGCPPTDARGKSRPATGCTAGAAEGSS